MEHTHHNIAGAMLATCKNYPNHEGYISNGVYEPTTDKPLLHMMNAMPKSRKYYTDVATTFRVYDNLLDVVVLQLPVGANSSGSIRAEAEAASSSSKHEATRDSPMLVVVVVNDADSGNGKRPGPS